MNSAWGIILIVYLVKWTSRIINNWVCEKINEIIRFGSLQSMTPQILKWMWNWHVIKWKKLSNQSNYFVRPHQFRSAVMRKKKLRRLLYLSLLLLLLFLCLSSCSVSSSPYSIFFRRGLVKPQPLQMGHRPMRREQLRHEEPAQTEGDPQHSPSGSP